MLPYTSSVEQSENCKEIIYKWSDKSGEGYHIKNTIVVSNVVRLPSIKEYNVLIAIQKIFIKTRISSDSDIKRKLMQGCIPYDCLTLELSLNDLAKELGYDSRNVDILEDLEESLHIISTMNITRKSEVENSNNTFLREIGYKYIDKLSIRSKNNYIENSVYFRISSIFYKMILENYKLLLQ